jgi:hypothetical protein
MGEDSLSQLLFRLRTALYARRCVSTYEYVCVCVCVSVSVCVCVSVYVCVSVCVTHADMQIWLEILFAVTVQGRLPCYRRSCTFGMDCT